MQRYLKLDLLVLDDMWIRSLLKHLARTVGSVRKEQQPNLRQLAIVGHSVPLDPG